VYSDIDADNADDAAEEIPRTAGGDFEYPFTEFAAPAGQVNACDHTQSDPGGWPDPIAVDAPARGIPPTRRRGRPTARRTPSRPSTSSTPSGPLLADHTSIAPRRPVTFDASAIRDPDSKILGYDWDFDGDGTVDRTTAGPATAFAYAAPGSFSARVAVRDFRGGAGTATRAIRVTRGPRVSVPRRGSRGRLTLRVQCAVDCALRGRLVLPRAQARVTVTLSVTARYPDGRSRTARRTLRVRL
jgi:hypothetical protein